MLIVLGSGLLALLVIAACLQPAPEGHGTHEQLGLPPCTFKLLFAVRCPSCGMTTAWSHFVRGQVIQSLAANSAGTLLAVVCLFTGSWSLVSGWQGKWFRRPPDKFSAVVLAVTLVTVTLVDWGARLLACCGR